MSSRANTQPQSLSANPHASVSLTSVPKQGQYQSHNRHTHPSGLLLTNGNRQAPLSPSPSNNTNITNFLSGNNNSSTGIANTDPQIFYKGPSRSEFGPVAGTGGTMKRRIWVKRPRGTATTVMVTENDIVDDLKTLVLMKYPTTLGQFVDPADLTIKVSKILNSTTNKGNETVSTSEGSTNLNVPTAITPPNMSNLNTGSSSGANNLIARNLINSDQSIHRRTKSNLPDSLIQFVDTSRKSPVVPNFNSSFRRGSTMLHDSTQPQQQQQQPQQISQDNKQRNLSPGLPVPTPAINAIEFPLMPDENVWRIIDKYFSSGMKIDDALLIEAPYMDINKPLPQVPSTRSSYASEQNGQTYSYADVSGGYDTNSVYSNNQNNQNNGYSNSNYNTSNSTNNNPGNKFPPNTRRDSSNNPISMLARRDSGNVTTNAGVINETHFPNNVSFSEYGGPGSLGRPPSSIQQPQVPTSGTNAASNSKVSTSIKPGYKPDSTSNGVLLLPRQFKFAGRGNTSEVTTIGRPPSVNSGKSESTKNLHNSSDSFEKQINDNGSTSTLKGVDPPAAGTIHMSSSDLGPSSPRPQTSDTNIPNDTNSLVEGREKPSNSPYTETSGAVAKKKESKPLMKGRSIKHSNQLESVVPQINVLIVEDNVINQKILEAFMKKRKVRCGVARNGKEALEKWRQGGYHLILMDIQLPVMSGIDVTKEIRRLEHKNRIGVFSPSEIVPEVISEDDLLDSKLFRSPIIIVALTASSLNSDRSGALQAGCNDFLTKPVSLQWLQQKITEWGCMQALIDFDGWRQWTKENDLSLNIKVPNQVTANTLPGTPGAVDKSARTVLAGLARTRSKLERKRSNPKAAANSIINNKPSLVMSKGDGSELLQSSTT
ncbi:hypothetical protein NADFUDRAFT_50203 [Nadsonia fulvescens var. elongata DSM 6958]|uniref:Response regulatory domain-containing protein n=1 Tax=Nadsonia fulvescens var. elongata DSM 6958 TaxID=857566 RepID=A0A1E3PLH3_9ASCO|nr:hypothetical protein NADFUDRAFT_50203 [Nadsonia fulvescens var. elongata DSM 6958]